MKYTPVSIKAKGNPHWKSGDRLSVTLKNGDIVETIILATTITIGLGYSQSIDAPSESGDSEFGRFSIRSELEKQKEVIEIIEDDLGVIEHDVIDIENIVIPIDKVIDIKDDYVSIDYKFREEIAGGLFKDLMNSLRLNASGLKLGVGLGGLDPKKIEVTPEGITIEELVDDEDFEPTNPDDVPPKVSNTRNMFPKIYIEKSQPDDSIGNNGDLWLVID